ncbi:hypothetical protein HYPSUDRAFT_202597 [Hypholoma sublateritium FD-334 SS-4]|uniref:Uncharacterized protein n=1 Tax=Hypholoma sublateritium (strain FD-334 SS-4) TaxID=945553 RepID=A0A0D2NZJ2_HYPSF|nr:hypothetical protein HYPSUDRAFT_202597 [Hypholoma sublateritium FD-334 SS-4]
MHIKRTGHPLIVREVLKEPIVTESEVVEWDRKALGQKFKQDGAAIAKAVEALDQVQLAALKGHRADYVHRREDVHAHPDILTIEFKTTTQWVGESTSNVFEPSFGLGRIFYTLLEHSFWSREQDIDRGVLSLPPLVAPTKVFIVPLSVRVFASLVKQVLDLGKRYSRNDELGTPYDVTLDFASNQKRTGKARTQLY